MKNQRLASLIERIGNLLRSQERASGSELGLQSVHVQMLGYLSQCNRYSNTPVGVTEFIGTTKGTTSQSINVLEKKGFITKHPDKNDGRVVHLDLTDKGKKFVESEIPPAEFCNTLENFNTKDTELLSQLLTRLLIQLQNQNNAKVFGVCHSCMHFRKYALGDLHQCGLTKEPLSENDSYLICREHEQPAEKTV